MGRANIHRRRVDLPPSEAQQAVVWSQGASPDRDFRQERRASQGRGEAASGAARAIGAVSRGEGRSGRRSDGARTSGTGMVAGPAETRGSDLCAGMAAFRPVARRGRTSDASAGRHHARGHCR